MGPFFSSSIFVIVLAVGTAVQAPPPSIPSAPEPQASQAASAPSMRNPIAGTDCLALRAQSETAITSRDYALAATLLGRAGSVCTNHEGVMISLAKAQMLSKQFDASASTLTSLLLKDPTNVPALLTQGELLYLIGKSPEAIKSLMQASALAPDNAEPHYLLGRVYYEQSSLQKAKIEFETALHLDATAYKAYDGLALCYENLGDTGQASTTYMRGLAAVYQAHPNYDVIYADFAELMLRFNKSTKAFELAREAAHRNPNAARNYLLAGRALEQSGKYADSLNWLLRSAQIDIHYPDPHLQLSRVYRKLGDSTKAKQESDLFVRLSSNAPQVRR